jgi:hypothetical protein
MLRNFSRAVVSWTTRAAPGILNPSRITAAARPPAGRLIQKHLEPFYQPRSDLEMPDSPSPRRVVCNRAADKWSNDCGNAIGYTYQADVSCLLCRLSSQSRDEIDSWRDTRAAYARDSTADNERRRIWRNSTD